MYTSVVYLLGYNCESPCFSIEFLAVIRTRLSVPVGEDRTTITFNFFIEVSVVGSLPNFYRSKREIAGLEKSLEEKPVPQTRV